jgi:PAS domain S-box-containing protein
MGETGDSEQVATSQTPRPDLMLRAIVDLTDDAIVTCDLDVAVLYFSESAERLFGRHPRDVLGSPVGSLFPLHLSDEIAGVFATVTSGERIRHFETEIVRPDGLPVPVSLSLAPLIDRDGTILGSAMVARDVTEQHLAQATLAEIDARLEDSEAFSHIGSWLWDLRTGAVQWSAEFHRIHEVDPLDFAGTFDSYMDLVSPLDSDRVRTAMTESVQGPRPLDLEYRVIDADQKPRVVRVSAEPTMGSDGKVVGLRGIGQDVTDQAGAPLDVGGPR